MGLHKTYLINEKNEVFEIDTTTHENNIFKSEKVGFLEHKKIIKLFGGLNYFFAVEEE